MCKYTYIHRHTYIHIYVYIYIYIYLLNDQNCSVRKVVEYMVLFSIQHFHWISLRKIQEGNLKFFHGEKHVKQQGFLKIEEITLVMHSIAPIFSIEWSANAAG